MTQLSQVIVTALRADRRVTHEAAARHDGPLLRAAGSASELADQPPLIALAVTTIVIGAVAKRPAVLRSGVRMLASHLLATGVKTVLKSAVNRTRPARALKEGHHIGKGDGGEDTSLNSFPSGHTVAGGRRRRRRAATLARETLPVRRRRGRGDRLDVRTRRDDGDGHGRRGARPLSGRAPGRQSQATAALS